MMWKLVMPAQNNISQWTGARQVMTSDRGWWECQITYPPIVGTSNFNAWRAFIAKMRGPTNDVQIATDPTAQSSLSNTMLSNGVNQTGRSIAVDGLPNSTTVLVAGQFVTIQDQLLQLTANVTSNGSGQATLSVEPPVRVAVPDNTAIEYKNPYCLMYIVNEPEYTVQPGYVYSLSLNLRECF
jgi:hypothetical protein